MDRLEHLEREALATRVRELEARLASASAPAPDLDFIAEQALKVLENSGISALIYDTEGALRILAANSHISAGAGYSATELAGMNLPQLLAGDDAERLKRLLRLPRQGGFSSAGGWRTRARSGEVRQVEVSGYDLNYRGRRARFVIVQDVTRRSQDRLAQQRLASIVETSQDAILSQTIEGIVLTWNPAAERLFGWPAADIVGRHCSVLLPEDVREQEMALIQACLTSGRPIERRETVYLHRGGTRLDVAMSLTPLRDASGTVLGASAVLRDLRPARREQAQRLLTSVVESSQDAIVSYDLEGAILSWNRGAEAMFGYRANEVLGRHFRQLAPASTVESTRALRERVVAGLPVPPFELVVRHKEGHAIVTSVTISVLRGGDGEIAGVVTMARDISAQKRTELLMARTQAIGRVGGWQVECPSGRLYWTEETFRIHGLSPGLFRPDPDSAVAFFAPEARSAIRSALDRAMQDGLAFDLELPLITAQGRRIWVRCIGEALLQDGRVAQVYGSLQDITERRETEDALRESERQLQSILNDAAEGIVVVGGDGAIDRLNLEARRMFGYPPQEDAPLTLRDLMLELEFAPGEEDSAQSIRPLLGSRREVTGRRRDGSLFPLELSLSEISPTSGRTRFTAVVRDITERKSWENRIYQLAYSDSLTGLPNRLLLRDRLEHAMAAADRNRTLVGVLFFDLDHFKAINDSYGHHIGDQLLRRIAERTRGCVREIDTVCRLGGDEFVVVLPELHEPADAAAVARKLLSTLSEPYPVDDRMLSITPTVGISVYPRDGADSDTLVRNADAAMYHAKESGKNRYWFYRPAASQ
jgi:diguanylate cyclase (GGDEF)-like protein/PAS domain S-box-containing protein